jgi:single-stranded DNA-binding protein
MKDVNKVILLGRLGADPIQRQTKSGTSVSHFSLATSRRIPKRKETALMNPMANPIESLTEPTPEADLEAPLGTKDSEALEYLPENKPEHREETQWHRVVVWGKQGEACTQFLKKGATVYVEGSIRTRNYADKAGLPKTSFEIQADTVTFVGFRQHDRQLH